jgi:hypothetical protein
MSRLAKVREIASGENGRPLSALEAQRRAQAVLIECGYTQPERTEAGRMGLQITYSSDQLQPCAHCPLCVVLSFSRNTGSYFSRPRLRSQLAASMTAPKRSFERIIVRAKDRVQDTAPSVVA